jgi:hypothetical protein
VAYRFQIYGYEDGPCGNDTMRMGTDTDYAQVATPTIGSMGAYTLLCGVWTPTADRDGADVWFQYACLCGTNLHLDDFAVYVGDV